MCDKEKQGEVSSDKTDSNAGSTSTGGQAWDIGKWVAQYCATQNPSERAELAKAIDAGRAVVLCNWLLKLHERIDAAGSLNALGRMVSVALHPGGQTLHTLDRLAELELFVLSKFEGGSWWDQSSALSESALIDLGRHVDLTSMSGHAFQRLGQFYADSDACVLEVLGRTVIVHPAEGEKASVGYWAIKVAKRGEPKEALFKEAGAQRMLRSLDARPLRSSLPEPVGILPLEIPGDVIEAIGEALGGLDALSLPEFDGKFLCFVYRVSDYGYFHYANRAAQARGGRKHIEATTETVADLQEALRKAMHDIFYAAAHGWMFTQVIDLYHHNIQADPVTSAFPSLERLASAPTRVADGDGRYLVLLDLLRDVARDRGLPVRRTFGMGRIDKFASSVIYPNVRASGIADVGDARIFSALCGSLKNLAAWFRAFKQAEPFVNSMTLANPWSRAYFLADPQSRRIGHELGFFEPKVTAARKIAEALREFDALTTIEQRARALLTLRINSVKAQDRDVKEVRQYLMIMAGLDPDCERDTRLVDLFLQGGDQPKVPLEYEQENAQESVARDLFLDVRHLLLLAEMDEALVEPYVMASYLSEYLICHLLLAGTYFCLNPALAAQLKFELELDPTATDKATPLLAQLSASLVSGCAAAVIGFCELPLSILDECESIVERFADFDRMARQIAFFMTEEHAKVIDLEGNPETICAELGRRNIFDVQRASKTDSDPIAIDLQALKESYDTDGRLWLPSGFAGDLGAYNGQMPIKEFEVLVYRLVPYVMLKRASNYRVDKK